MQGRFEKRGSVGIIWVNNPPVNAISVGVRAALIDGVAKLAKDPEIEIGILACEGRTFMAGADITEFGKPPLSPGLHDAINAVESSAKPIVAAIHGTAFGGGLEVALGCHYRVAIAGAKVGLPEVKLGLLPGAGGTQRLPRVVGVETALNMILSGTPVAAEKLGETQLFDRVADGDLLQSALGLARELIAEKRGPRRVRDLRINMPNAEAYLQFARNTVKAVAGPYPAPLACVEAVAAATHGSFEAGIKRERGLFSQLMLTPESA